MSVFLLQRFLCAPVLAASVGGLLCLTGQAHAGDDHPGGTCPRPVSTQKYKIGDTGPGGGTIFFVDYHNQYPCLTYLEAAPASAEAVIGEQPWCGDSSTSIPAVNGWAAKAVGRGQANTRAMLSPPGPCTSGAANAADAYLSPNGKDDWFLPSLGELMLMYTNLLQAGKGAFSFAVYWSSSEYGANHAWFQNFAFGGQNPDPKSSTFLVRPVRAF